MKFLKYTCFFFLVAAITNCSNPDENKITEQTLLKKDSIPPSIIADSIPVDTTQKAPLVDYTGTYKLRVTRYREFYCDHLIELIQNGDSVYGNYTVKFFTKAKEKIAFFNTTVKGSVDDTENDVNSGSTLEIKIDKQDVDSVVLKANPEALYMIDKFIGSMLSTKFLIDKNTIQNNYAGGEWDIWKRIN